MNKEYKICFITTISKSLEWFVVDAAKYLYDNGYKDITFISNMDDEFIKTNSFFAKCINIDYARGVNIFNFFKSISKTKKIFKNNKFDLIYYLTPNASFYASLAGKKAKIPNRIYAQCGIRYVSYNGLKRKIFKFIEKKTCKMSTSIRSVSRLNMKFAIEEKLAKPDKFKILGIGGTIGVDFSYCDSFNRLEKREELRKSLGISKDSFVFGFVGRLNVDKGCNELIEAFKILTKKYRNIYLAHVGMVDESNLISEENYKYYLKSDNVIKIGTVPPNSVYEYMSTMDILVHPTYREGFGKVLEEAMAMYLPIITTDVIGPKEVVEDGKSGLLVEARNVSALSSTMEMLMNDKKLREYLAANGRIRAEKYFDRKIMVKNIYEDFNRILLKDS